MARKRSPALTDAEARVMSVVWERQTATVGDVVAALQKGRAVTYSTVQTILRILETKGYVTHDKVARAFVYRPAVDERQARQRALRHLVTRLFNPRDVPARIRCCFPGFVGPSQARCAIPEHFREQVLLEGACDAFYPRGLN